jgi:hypothetical protein
VERRRTSVRFATAVAVALVAAAGLASCSRGEATGPAATVDGVKITRAELNDFLAASQRFYDQAAELEILPEEQADEVIEASKGAGADTFSRTEVDSALQSLIQAELIRAELTRRDALPTDDDLEAARADLVGQLSPEAAGQIDEEYLEISVNSRASIAALQRELADEADAGIVAPDPAEVEAQRDALYEQLVAAQPFCVSGLQTETEAEGQAARDRIDGGQDIATVANELGGEGSAPDGDLGCTSAESITQITGTDGATLAVGDRFGPVGVGEAEGTGPFLVFEITSDAGPTREAVQAQLEAEVPSEVAPTDPSTVELGPLVGELFADAEIEVDPRYGSWNAETLSLEPPVGGTTTTLPPLELTGG